MALHFSVLISLLIIVIAVSASLIATIWFYKKSRSAKQKRIISWLAFTNLSLLLWTIFHLFLDIDVFPIRFVEFVHYWIVHIFIVVSAIGIFVAAKLLSRK